MLAEPFISLQCGIPANLLCFSFTASGFRLVIGLSIRLNGVRLKSKIKSNRYDLWYSIKFMILQSMVVIGKKLLGQINAFFFWLRNGRILNIFMNELSFKSRGFD